MSKVYRDALIAEINLYSVNDMFDTNIYSGADLEQLRMAAKAEGDAIAVNGAKMLPSSSDFVDRNTASLSGADLAWSSGG